MKITDKIYNTPLGILWVACYEKPTVHWRGLYTYTNLEYKYEIWKAELRYHLLLPSHVSLDNFCTKKNKLYNTAWHSREQHAKQEFERAYNVRLTENCVLYRDGVTISIPVVSHKI